MATIPLYEAADLALIEKGISALQGPVPLSYLEKELGSKDRVDAVLRSMESRKMVMEYPQEGSGRYILTRRGCELLELYLNMDGNVQ